MKEWLRSGRRIIAVAAIALALALVGGACADGDDGRPRASPVPPTITALPTVSLTPAEGACAPGTPHEAGSTDETLASGGVEREYLLHVPPSYTGADAVPLLVSLHGFGSEPQIHARYSALPEKADVEGFILVMPQAAGDPAGWDILADSTDVSFIDDLLDALTAELCIDEIRVYVAGMSSGAAMAVTLGAQLSDRIAAIAPVAGVYPWPPKEPVSVIAFHGTDDAVVPFEGGRLRGEDSGLAYPPVEESIRQWADHNGCAKERVEEQPAESVRLLRYTECDRGTSVELYIVEGAGHTWPSEEAHGISATDVMWEFFEAHPKR